MGKRSTTKHQPATKIVYWTGGKAYCCDMHADKIEKLEKFMMNIARVEPFSGDKPCANCANGVLDTYRVEGQR